MFLDAPAARGEAVCVTRLPWLLPFGLLVFATIAVPLHLLDEDGLPRYEALQRELRDTEEANRRLRRDVRRLARTVRRLETSYEAVEEIAREQLGLVHRGEWVVIAE